jgi:TonB-linked SusC/RagA family outer membrane protein
MNFYLFFKVWAPSRTFHKILLAMKLTIVLMIIVVSQVNANSYGQKITLSGNNAPIDKIFDQIREQSGYDFFYNLQIIKKAKPVTIHVKNAAIEEVLAKCFLNQPFTYTVQEKAVIVREKEKSIQGKNFEVMIPVNIRGKVADRKGQPLPGVTIKLKGTSIGASTDVNGNYSLNIPEATGTLVFSFIGYKSQEVTVTNRTTVDVTLQEDISGLSEVVVVGYGSVMRKDLTGSVASVNVQDMQKAPVRSFEEALAGRAAGVQVQSVDGKPGSGININIRGVNSLTQDNSPLYVIDGFPLQNPDNNFIDPSQIETIDILKDASATAIYGARGSNGVVIITTKRGKTGEPVISYSGTAGIYKNFSRTKLLSPYEFVKLQAELNANTPYLQAGRTLEDYRNVKGYDWQEMLYQTGVLQNHSLSLSGGTEKTRYLLSGNSFGQDGIIINSGFKRYQGRINLDQVVNSKLKVGTDFQFTNTSIFGLNPVDAGSRVGLFYSAYAYRPVEVAGLDRDVDIEDSLYDPFLLAGDLRTNPFYSAQNEVRNNITNSFRGNIFLEYAILKDLKLRVSGSLDNRLVRVESFDNSKTSGGSRAANGVNGSVTNSQFNNFDNTNTITYNKVINKDHDFNLVGGFQVQKSKTNAFGLRSTLLPNEALGISGLEQGTLQQAGSTALLSYSTLASVLARLNYKFKNKYLVTGTFRSDGSSKFRNENKWSDFSAFAVGWVFSEESFVKKLGFLSEGKVRVSYGTNGNNRVGDFASYAIMSFNLVNTYPFNNTLYTSAGAVTTLDNPDLKWETTTTTDIGLDIGLFKDRIRLTTDYYNKITKDLLLNATLPTSTGYTSAVKNIGSIGNKGLEFTLNTVNVLKEKFSWTTNFNISFNRNKLLSLAPNQYIFPSATGFDFAFSATPSFVSKIGDPLGNLYGWIFDGLYTYDDFDKQTNGLYILKNSIAAPAGYTRTAGTGIASASVMPGDAKYRDLNNDGIINSFDRTIIGRGYPIHTGGISNNFQYKSFDLNFLFQWSYGSDIHNANRIWFERGYATFRPANNNMFAAYANRWTPDNTNTDIPRLRTNQALSEYSTREVEDGSYLRLKTLNFGYSLPSRLIRKAKIKSLRVFVSAQNLYTWTTYSGNDPEVNSFPGNVNTPSLDWSSYPRPLTISGGINLSL